MGKKGHPLAGIEAGLREANTNIRGDRNESHRTKNLVGTIITTIMTAMKQQSPNVFEKLYVRSFGTGSSYEGLKIGAQGDFDIDILLKMPDVTLPLLHEDGSIPGYAKLQLQNFNSLENNQPELYSAMSKFVDKDNYLLNTELKSTFIQSIFDKTRAKSFPDDIVKIGEQRFKIVRVQNLGPGFTLTIQGVNVHFLEQVDLVPCILLPSKCWPKGFRSNPYSTMDFFIVPKKPNCKHPHLDKYFRFSFQEQERVIIFNRFWMKPTIRILKSIRDHFDQDVPSYALKTLCMWELLKDNPTLGPETEFWKKAPSDCLIYILEKYLECLTNHEILDFWNDGLNLLTVNYHLSTEKIDRYKKQVKDMLADLKANPKADVLLGYLSL